MDKAQRRERERGWDKIDLKKKKGGQLNMTDGERDEWEDQIGFFKNKIMRLIRKLLKVTEDYFNFFARLLMSKDQYNTRP